jgi:hypothetical protein
MISGFDREVLMQYERPAIERRVQVKGPVIQGDVPAVS